MTKNLKIIADDLVVVVFNGVKLYAIFEFARLLSRVAL